MPVLLNAKSLMSWHTQIQGLANTRHKHSQRAHGETSICGQRRQSSCLRLIKVAKSRERSLVGGVTGVEPDSVEAQGEELSDDGTQSTPRCQQQLNEGPRVDCLSQDILESVLSPFLVVMTPLVSLVTFDIICDVKHHSDDWYNNLSCGLMLLL